MSPEGEKVTSPIVFKPDAVRWAHKVRRQIDDLPPPVGYGANRALLCSQFSAWVEMPSFSRSLYKILKTVFDCCGIIIQSNDGSFKYDEDFVWYSTDDFPSVWSLVWAWLVALPDEDMPNTFTSQGVEPFWEKQGFRMLRRWESFGTLNTTPGARQPLFSLHCLVTSW